MTYRELLKTISTYKLFIETDLDKEMGINDYIEMNGTVYAWRDDSLYQVKKGE